MSDASQQSPVKDPTPSRSRTSEEEFVRYLARWAFLVSASMLLFDLAVVRNYPFPSIFGDRLRGLFYTTISILIFVASVFLAFLGYRIISLKYVGRTKVLYIIFLPAVLLVTSIFWFIVLAS